MNTRVTNENLSSPESPTALQGESNRSTQTLLWIAAAALTTILTAWLRLPPLAITIVVLLGAARAGFAISRQHQKEESERINFLRKTESEVRRLRDRWQILQQEADQTITALSGMRDGVILLNQNFEIMLLNPSANYLLNLTKGQSYEGRVFHEVVRIPALTRAVDATDAETGPQKLLVEIVNGESIRPIRARVDRFSSSSHHNLLVTLRDETEAHRIEEIRREFVANVSHELKTPLAAIKGYAETIELAIRDDPEAAGYFLNQIQGQCQRLERLIADMLQLARAQSGRGNMRITAVSLPQVVADAIDSNAPVAETKNIQCTIVPPTSEVIVMADYEAILTIANNLISNAIRYTPQHGGIQISCHTTDDYCALIVKDNGVGISAPEQKRIFERFYRVEKSRNSGDGGTGIGLSVVKNLIDALGGQISVTSQPASGSSFEVRLPRGDITT